MSVNKVVLIGRLGGEPETKSFSNGGSLCSINLATSESWKDKQTGERKERTEWHRITLNNRLGEIAQQYLHKGSQVYIEGRIQTRKWQDQNGQDRYSTEIIASNMTMLNGKTETSIVPDSRDKPKEPVGIVPEPWDKPNEPVGIVSDPWDMSNDSAYEVPW